MKHTYIFFLLIISSYLHCSQNCTVDAEQMLDYPVIISLERHMYRYDETVQLMEKAGFTNIQRFEAIDGKCTSDEFFKSLNILEGSPGQKGCAASHLLIWKSFSEDNSDKPYLFVCEDDMAPHSEFHKIFPIYWEATPKDFDLVMVGSKFDLDKFSRHDLIVSIPSITTHAYIISKKGAKKLYDLYQNIPCQSDEEDYVLDLFLKAKMSQKKMIYYCYNGKIYPEKGVKNMIKHITKYKFKSGICFQNNELPSTISHKKKKKK